MTHDHGLTSSALGSPSHVGRRLTIGWATAVAMWALAYVTFMGPGFAVGEVLVAAMGACLVLGGFVAGRTGGVRDGLIVGLVTACVNLLLVGSIFGSKDAIDPKRAIAWVATLFVASLALGAIGGALGGRSARPPRQRHWPGVFAMVGLAAMLLLLITGGLVTGLRAGLDVPDWPNSFGHNMLLYPLSEMKGGVYYEHAHRLYGSLVGLTTLALTVLIWRTDRRWWLKALVAAVFLCVCIQGLMGGLRVTGELTLSQDRDALRPNTALAIAHGVFSQVVFAMLAIVVAATSTRWMVAPVPEATDASRRDRVLTAVVLAAMFVQVFLGVSYRQIRTWGAIDGTPASPPAWALHGHLTMAVVVLVLTIWVAIRAMTLHSEERKIAGLGKAVLGILGTQFVLGVAALVIVLIHVKGTPPGDTGVLNTGLELPPPLPPWGLALTTAHQAVGALLVAHVAMLAAWVRRAR